MKELPKFQIWAIFVLLATGIAMVTTNLIAVIFIFMGHAFIAMAMALLMLECGPCAWHWWIPFRMGHYVRLSEKTWVKNQQEIDGWLKENIRFTFMRRREGIGFYFWRNADAMGFKLRWI